MNDFTIQLSLEELRMLEDIMERAPNQFSRDAALNPDMRRKTVENIQDKLDMALRTQTEYEGSNK